MATASLPTKKMPLPVELFSGAMQQQLPLADYARNIDLHPDILSQALTGRLPGADSAPVNALAKAINRDPEQVDLTTLACDESFSAWLKRNMEGISHHALRARAQLDSKMLKCFLSGDVLPDSDQAERISRALYIDRMEIARVITANMAAASASTIGQASPESGAVVRPANAPAEVAASASAGRAGTGAQRRRTSPRQASAEPASAPAPADPPPIDELVSSTLEAHTGAAEQPLRSVKRPKRASKPEAQLPDRIGATLASHTAPDEVASFVPAEAHGGLQDDASVPAASPQVDQELQPAAQSTRRRKSSARHQPNQPIASGLDASAGASASVESGRQPGAEAYPASQPAAPAAADHAELAAPAAPAKTVAEKEAGDRRLKRSTTRSLASAAAAEYTPAAAEAQMAAEDRRVAEPAAQARRSAQASASRKPRAIAAKPADIYSSGQLPSTSNAPTSAPEPDQQIADITTDRAAPLVTAECASDTTSLQLSVDEVRLIRHWRQLHPHGRRATLHYIGSLLVDD